jgi:hypothetical protein
VAVEVAGDRLAAFLQHPGRSDLWSAGLGDAAKPCLPSGRVSSPPPCSCRVGAPPSVGKSLATDRYLLTLRVAAPGNFALFSRP